MFRKLKASLESTGMMPPSLQNASTAAAPMVTNDQQLKDEAISVVRDNEVKMDKIYKDNAYLPPMLHHYVKCIIQ